MTEQTKVAAARPEPEGIGGWLILPLIGIVLSPVTGLTQVGTYLGLGESWAYLNSGQKIFLVAEAAGVLATAIVIPVVLLVLLFRKLKAFPRFYVAWAIINIAFLFVDLVGAKLLFGEVFEQQGLEFFDGDTIKSIVRALALVVIWTPYMLMSRRVTNTFVN